ncbi:hypothetical protein BDV25DRAFT_144881 [Aspergillus avenaceus]|uniref:Uncharacterized protein n=1 Tax=Aspergillus avenaceus TaxID=36643 RepID=A0A5N6TFV6_ASPAV|nr:hypothetical protein BDV25DRAFT_144881 [Aspergillus avenaceus]
MTSSRFNPAQDRKDRPHCEHDGQLTNDPTLSSYISKEPLIQLVHPFTKAIFVISSISLLLLVTNQIVRNGSFYAISHAFPFAKAINSIVAGHQCSLPTARYDLQTGKSMCYPSSGGVWMADLAPLELQQLGIDRFDSSPRSCAQDEEDRFCQKLRLLGGSWYHPQCADKLWNGSKCRTLHELEPTFAFRRWVGYPDEGGVWVLRKPDSKQIPPESLTALQNALTMEELCIVLQRLGAVFCKDIKRCQALNDLHEGPDHWPTNEK